MNALALVYVGCGGAFGAMMRYAASDWVARFNQTSFPYATLSVNLLGCLLMGIWVASAMLLSPAKIKDLHLLLAVGALGGFTTFSAFSLEVFLLGERALYLQMAIYIAASVIGSVVALLAGIWLVKWVVA